MSDEESQRPSLAILITHHSSLITPPAGGAEERGGPLVDLMDRLSQYRSEEAKLKWEGSFADYFDLVKKNPKIARLAHARIFDMIMAAGVHPHGENEPPTYEFFSQELYGVDHALRQVVDYFSSAAQRLEVRKRILLLMGPVGGGKSTIVSMLKRGLEAPSRSD